MKVRFSINVEVAGVRCFFVNSESGVTAFVEGFHRLGNSAQLLARSTAALHTEADLLRFAGEVANSINRNRGKKSFDGPRAIKMIVETVKLVLHYEKEA